MWNLASERESALLWMRLSTVGWAFPGALVTHLMQRYAEEYPIPELRAKRRLLICAKYATYATGAAGAVPAMMVIGASGCSCSQEASPRL